jgi:hypothetical protein
LWFVLWDAGYQGELRSGMCGLRPRLWRMPELRCRLRRMLWREVMIPGRVRFGGPAFFRPFTP